MVEDGLFDQFPCDAIFGLHNMPGQPLGKIGLRDGAMMASSDTLHIEVKGVGGRRGAGAYGGCHAGGLPYYPRATVIVSRNITPFEPAVVTVGSIRPVMRPISLTITC